MNERIDINALDRHSIALSSAVEAERRAVILYYSCDAAWISHPQHGACFRVNRIVTNNAKGVMQASPLENLKPSWGYS